MPVRSSIWVFIVDARHGVLWRGRPAPERHYHFERVDLIESGWEQHQHARPSPLGAKNGHTHASWAHESETLIKRFSKDVASWLDREIARRGIEVVHLFAPPRFLGELRRCLPDRLADRIVEHAGSLGYLRGGDLARHPAIAELIEA